MTAVPNPDIVEHAGTDAELARAAATGDRGAFAGIYDRYADRLYDFCVGMLRDRDVAADCVQDVFCTAATRLSQLREPDKLRPWLYAIARNEALRHIRERRREVVSEELPDAVSYEPGPDTLATRTELADLVAEAAGGLSDRDRSVLDLAYRHGLDGPDLADALGVSPATANKIVHRLRETVERSLGALLVSRRVRKAGDGCPELTAILEGWDGQFSVLVRKRIARHIESCLTCDEERQRLVSPAALLGGAPVFIPAPPWLRERTLGKIQLTCSSAPIEATLAGADLVSSAVSQASPIPVEPFDDVRDDRRRPGVLVIVLFIAVLSASLGLTIIWLQQRNITITPTDVSETAPEPIVTPPAGPPIPTLGDPLAPPLPEVESTAPGKFVPPDVGTPAVQAPAQIAPPPESEPDPPIYELPIPPSPPPSKPSLTLQKPSSVPSEAGNSPGAARNSPRAANDSPGGADNSPGVAGNSSGTGNNSSGPANDTPGGASNSRGAADSSSGPPPQRSRASEPSR